MTAEPGHNSGVTGAELRQFIERIESVESDIKDLQDDRKAIYAEAKGRGFDTKALRKLVSIRKQDPEKRAEENAILDLYGSAIGVDVFG